MYESASVVGCPGESLDCVGGLGCVLHAPDSLKWDRGPDGKLDAPGIIECEKCSDDILGVPW